MTGKSIPCTCKDCGNEKRYLHLKKKDITVFYNELSDAQSSCVKNSLQLFEKHFKQSLYKTEIELKKRVSSILALVETTQVSGALEWKYLPVHFDVGLGDGRASHLNCLTNFTDGILEGIFTSNGLIRIEYLSLIGIC